MFRGFFHSIREAFFQLFHNRVMSFVSIFTITAVLVILGLFLSITVNINSITENIKYEFDTIEIYLEDYTTKSDAQIIAKSLASMEEVSTVEYISREQAMKEFKERWGENAYLLDSLTSNPLPNSLRVTLYDLAGGSLVAEVASTMMGVEDVKYRQNEINKVLNFSKTIQKGTLAMIFSLVIVSVIVVSSTIKLTVMAREDEINIMKYIGATNWFVRGPFLIEGILLGFISSFLSLWIISMSYSKICGFFGDENLSLFSGTLVDLNFMMENLKWIFLSLGVSIGAVGSIISMRKFLKV